LGLQAKYFTGTCLFLLSALARTPEYLLSRAEEIKAVMQSKVRGVRKGKEKLTGNDGK
jgi:hypothetical protein